MLKLIRSLRILPRRLRSVGLVREDQGATAVEYAVMLALILLTCLASVIAVGNSTADSWSNTNTQLNNVGFGS